MSKSIPSVFDRLPVTGAPQVDAAGLVPGDARPGVALGVVARAGRAEPLRKTVHRLGSAPRNCENHAGPQNPALALHAHIAEKPSGFL